MLYSFYNIWIATAVTILSDIFVKSAVWARSGIVIVVALLRLGGTHSLMAALRALLFYPGIYCHLYRAQYGAAVCLYRI